ncbi:hypothetical protein ACFL96_04935 [Thermoproteota archaeon]
MKKRLLFALILMGFTSLVVQIVLIREFLVCFYGNELTIGLILGNWIILEAIGSSLASRLSQRNRRPLTWYATLQVLIAIYFPIAIYLARSVKNFFPLTVGEGVGLIPIVISSFFIIAPLSIFDGAQFPLGCRIYKDQTKQYVQSTGRVYILEAIGFIIAGPIFTYILLNRLNAFYIALLISLLNLFCAILLLKRETKFSLKPILLSIVAILLGIGIISIPFRLPDNLEHISLAQQWKSYNLIDSKNSNYGNLAVTKEDEQYTFFSDGIPIITTPVPDIVAIEELIHFGMLSHKKPHDVLIIGGGAGGPIREILKHPVRHLDYIEIDPLLISMIRNHPSDLTRQELKDERLSIKISDGGRYIKTTERRYDLIFLNLPIPTTLQLNRFYTKDFFHLAGSAFKDDKGIFVCKLPGSLGYINTQLRQLNLSVLETLKKEFKFVKVIPGDSNIYLASQSDLFTLPHILTRRRQARGVATKVLTPMHVEYRLHRRWSDWFEDSLKQTPDTDTNSLLLPKGLFYSLSYWNNLFSPQLDRLFEIVEKIKLKFLLIFVASITILLAILCKAFKRLKNIVIPYAIFTTGTLGMTFNLIFIFTYQSFYGNVYHHIALLITAFMAGLTLGGWMMTKRIARIWNKKRYFITFELDLILFSLILVPALLSVGASKLNLSFVFFLLSALSGLLVGSEFPLANSFYKARSSSQTAGILYALDLAGSWIGAVVVAVFFVPIIGLLETCIFLALLKLSSLILIALFTRN